MAKFIFTILIFFTLTSVEGNAQLANKNMYLLSNLDSHSTPYSAVLGYKAPDGREYAILGCFDGTSFIDITDPENIHEVDFVISTAPGNSSNLWREMKTYSHYAYIVSEVSNSGIQIVDLQYLPDSVRYIKKFIPAGHTASHSISQFGPYLYLNGCSGSIGNGVTVFDLSIDPETPVKKGSYNADYIHDCRIVNDTIYAANIFSGKVSIIDATNKNSLFAIKVFNNLPNAGPHNTALTDDRKYLLVTDEIGSAPYRLKFWNIEDVNNPVFITSWQPTGITASIVHNVEVYGNFALAAHYSAGIRMIDISNPLTPTEIAWYDTYPLNDDQSYEGCWGAYMFPSGKIAVSDRSTGLYVLKTNFNINCAIEGYYNSSLNSMSRKDTVKVYLRNTSSPYSVIDSSKALIDSLTLLGNCKFNYAPGGTYYIVLKHRSCIETWSRSGGENYDPETFSSYTFISSDAQSYGNNVKQVDTFPLRYALFSGDVNQDGSIDASDIISIYNDVTYSVSGYVPTDLDYNSIVDVSDLLICYNNNLNVIGVIRP